MSTMEYKSVITVLDALDAGACIERVRLSVVRNHGGIVVKAADFPDDEVIQLVANNGYAYTYGQGAGYGYGDGQGDGYGDGYGDDHEGGDGNGHGAGDESGDGYGDGYGDGSGCGDMYGYGYGDGNGSGGGEGEFLQPSER